MSGTDKFIHTQLSAWPAADAAFRALSRCRRRYVTIGEGARKTAITLLYNPARIRSTAAKVDAVSVSRRPCFLCSANRPEQQLVHPALHDLGYDMLLNPFPVLDPHFTIVHQQHLPQQLPLEAMKEAAMRFPSLAFFFNGAMAGASAPDHLHFQAVATTDVALLAQVEAGCNDNNTIWSGDNGINHPAGFWSIMDFNAALPHIPDMGLLNAFVWMRADGRPQCILFPRRRHRPRQYPDPMISPGALDVAGMIVTVREEDFNALTSTDVTDIYSQTCYSPFEKPVS